MKLFRQTRKILRETMAMSADELDVCLAEVARDFSNAPPVLLPYQQRWNTDASRVKVVEKSRRIGISWADAAQSALDGASADGADTWYLGYNREMAEQYIDDVAFWAKAYQLAATEIEEDVLKGEEDILVFRVRFASGRKVVALSSNPANLRAKKGNIVIDEAAFHKSFDEIVKAAMAALVWGGKVRVISTHDGKDNPFNKLCRDIESGKLNYSLHRTTFSEAIAQGLYRRICLTTGAKWDETAQDEWVKAMYAFYGVGASEELDCIPRDKTKVGKFFQANWFDRVDSVSSGNRVRFWDLAATAAEVRKDACYTVGILMGLRSDGTYFVEDMVAEQYDPGAVEDLIWRTARRDGRGVKVRWERQPAAAGKWVDRALIDKLDSYDCVSVPPKGDKLERAQPFARQASIGKVKVGLGNWGDRLISWLCDFPEGGKDATDACTGAYWELVQEADEGSVAVKEDDLDEWLRVNVGG